MHSHTLTMPAAVVRSFSVRTPVEAAGKPVALHTAYGELGKCVLAGLVLLIVIGATQARLALGGAVTLIGVTAASLAFLRSSWMLSWALAPLRVCKNPESAIKRLQLLRGVSPGSVRHWEILGDVLLVSGRYRDAERLYRRCLRGTDSDEIGTSGTLRAKVAEARHRQRSRRLRPTR